MRHALYIALLLIVPSVDVHAQAALTPQWDTRDHRTPEQKSEDARVRRAFEDAQASSETCKRMHIGCPEGAFTQGTLAWTRRQATQPGIPEENKMNVVFSLLVCASLANGPCAWRGGIDLHATLASCTTSAPAIGSFKLMAPDDIAESKIEDTRCQPIAVNP
jgi:hypothetical protein